MESDINYMNCNIFLWKKGGVAKHFILQALDFESFSMEFDYIVFLKSDPNNAFHIPNINEIIKALEKIYENDQNAFIVLTPRRKASDYESGLDGLVYSFSCNFHHFKKILNNCNGVSADNLLFYLLDQIFKGNSNFEQLLVRQIPIQAMPVLPGSSCDVIIPHRGENSYLDNLLFFLDQIKGIDIYVGVDQQMTDRLMEFRFRYPKVSFYNFSPDPVGPYVIRNHLIRESNREIVFFQDSDDIPCADRFEQLAGFMLKNGCQLCGSNELRVDYFDKTVQAIRFPADVKKALQAKVNGHPLLHPTSAITREAFYSCGRFSEDRTFGYDTQFLLRSFFLLNSMMNIDEFLYIRRLRPGSLTTAPGTMMESPIRQKSLKEWFSDFEQIKRNQLKPSESRLNYRAPTFPVKMKKLI